MAIKPKDKRCSPRITLRTPVRCQIRGEAEFHNSLCENISLGGLSFVGNKFIVPKTPVMLEVNVLSRILHPVGQVVWSQPLPHSNRNRLGIEFLELDPQENNFLKDFINLQTTRI